MFATVGLGTLILSTCIWVLQLSAAAPRLRALASQKDASVTALGPENSDPIKHAFVAYILSYLTGNMTTGLNLLAFADWPTWAIISMAALWLANSVTGIAGLVVCLGSSSGNCNPLQFGSLLLCVVYNIIATMLFVRVARSYNRDDVAMFFAKPVAVKLLTTVLVALGCVYFGLGISRLYQIAGYHSYALEIVNGALYQWVGLYPTVVTALLRMIVLNNPEPFSPAKHGDEDSETRKRARELISRMAHVLGSLQPLIDPLSGSIPGAGAAVGACTVIIKLERTRKQNSQHIVAVCNAMVNMLAVLRHLNPSLEGPRGRYPDALFKEIDHMSASIRNFGTFADTYYTRYARKVVRFILSRDINCRLQSHVKSFRDHEQTIMSLLTIHTTVTVEQIYRATDLILQKLDDAEKRASAPAMEVVRAHGGEEAVRKNPDLVNEVAKALGDNEPLSSNMYKTLIADIESILEQHRSSFEARLLSAKDEIIVRLTQGPHDLLVDDDVKEVWRVNSWKLSVKYRVFVDSLHTHFDSGPDPTTPGEPWALKVLSKVINHPAIGEAIDEDSSGFLSINEVNEFLRCKPADCSTPAWFAFWAVGWRYMNVLYAFKIKNLLVEVKSRCVTLMSPCNGAELGRCFDAYLESLQRVDAVNTWVDHAGNDTDEDVFAEVDGDTRIFSETLAHSTEHKLLENLTQFDFMVEDSSHLLLILHGVLMVLLNLILAKHLELLGNLSTNFKPAQTMQDMSNGLEQILKEFSSRIRSLIRSWRSQKLDVDVQISCYAGGLLYGWYQHIMDHPQDINRYLRGIRSNNARSPSRSNSIDGYSPALAERLKSMEDRLARMERNIERLMRVIPGNEGR
ncbi:hypothetical protein AURDEDRAFT_184061 [Auricularia subglabra TFB-10046 SS5]|nr:hypothetical protein AURDEDRAFT_184061 [Auricularia subglabra TFB-10046 SS5]